MSLIFVVIINMNDSWLAYYQDLDHSAIEGTFTMANVAKMRHASYIDKNSLKSEVRSRQAQFDPMILLQSDLAFHHK